MISVVTPTFRRPKEVAELFENLSEQTLLPMELVLVDGAPLEEKETEKIVEERINGLPFKCVYLRHTGGTAIQRNAGIEAAKGNFMAFVDDDVRLEKTFLQEISKVFDEDKEKKIGGIVGYRENQHFDSQNVTRWRWYKRLKLFSTYEPGRYDFTSGYPINANMQKPFSGVREVDFMTTACAVWRREVFDEGFRFDTFFRDYGVLEDAHFSLRAGKNWKLLQCGDARCKELHSPNGRVDSRKIGYKCVVNYYYVFQETVQPLTWQHKARFWRFQTFELLRLGLSAVRRLRSKDLSELRGRLEGIATLASGKRFSRFAK